METTERERPFAAYRPLTQISTRPAPTVQPGWKLPAAPSCPECGELASAAVINTGDGWAWGWECADCGPDRFTWDGGDDGIGDEIAWPFGADDYAYGRHWEALGFWLV